MLFDKSLDSPPIVLHVTAQIQSPVSLEPRETLFFEVDADRNANTSVRLFPQRPEIKLIPQKLKTVGRADLVDMRSSERELELKFEGKDLSEKDFNLVQKVLVVYSDEGVPSVEFEWQLDLPLEIEGVTAIYPKLVPLRQTGDSLSARFFFLGSIKVNQNEAEDKLSTDFRVCVGDSVINCNGRQLGPTKWLINFETSQLEKLQLGDAEEPILAEFQVGSVRLPIRFVRGL